jgi:hypothetical protein
VVHVFPNVQGIIYVLIIIHVPIIKLQIVYGKKFKTLSQNMWVSYNKWMKTH